LHFKREINVMERSLWSALGCESAGPNGDDVELVPTVLETASFAVGTTSTSSKMFPLAHTFSESNPCAQRSWNLRIEFQGLPRNFGLIQ